MGRCLTSEMGESPAMTSLLTWLLAIVAALWLWFMPVQYEGDGGDAAMDPPPTIAAVDVADP